MKYYLIDIDNSDFIEVSNRITLGRKSICDIVIKDDLVSGRHCRFLVISNSLFVEDLGASNPVQINNQEMKEKSKTRLKVKDKLKIGSSQYYVSKTIPEGDSTYKSMVLEKVKIHETFDSDLDYDKYEEHWHEEVSKKKSNIVKIQKKMDKVTSKKEKIENLKKQVEEIDKNLSTLNEKRAENSKLSKDAIDDKISHFTERINFYTEKRDELFAIQTINSEYNELNDKKDIIKSKISDLSEKGIDEEHEELSKQYKTAIHELEELNKKIKES